jgi:hypothetical protein
VFLTFLLACIWIQLHRSQSGPLVGTYLYHTNTVNGHGTAILRVENRSRRGYAFKVETDHLEDSVWGRIAYPGGSLNSSCAGFVGGESNILVQVHAPDKDERFCITYCRIPSRLENYASWTVTWTGMRYPFGPKDKTIFIYPVR